MPPLSPAEKSILADAGFFQVKNGLDQKVRAIFDELQDALNQTTQGKLEYIPPELLQGQSRFYRGENHNGYPWRAVDHLTLIRGADIFCLRALLLYGCHLSLHLILSGKWMDLLAKRIVDAQTRLSIAGFEESRSDSPWDWHYGPDTHGHIGETNQPRKFLKISLHMPPDQLDVFREKANQAWATLLPILFEG